MLAGDQSPMTVALNNVVNTSTGVVEYNVNMAAAIIAALPTFSSTSSPAATSCAA